MTHSVQPEPDEARQDPPARLDTVGIALPVADFDRVGCTHQIVAEGTEAESHRYRRPLAGGGFIGTGVGQMAWLEASLPKRADPDGDNSVALDLEPAMDVLRDLVAEALQFIDLEPGTVIDDGKVVRLDLVRDFFGVDRQTELLDGLASVVQPGRAKVRRFADPSANRAETVRVGPRAWGCTLYDKHTETGGKAPAGQVRFEARLHHDQLTSRFSTDLGARVNSVADLLRMSGSGRAEVYHMGRAHLPPKGAAGPSINLRVVKGGGRRIERHSDGGAALARAQRGWFERVGFHLEVRAPHELATKLAAAHFTSAEAASLWAFLTLPGWAASCSRNTRSKYRRMALDLGVAPAFDGELVRYDAAEGVRLRLDYDTGTMVAA